MDRTLVLGAAVGGLKQSPNGTAVLLLDRSRPVVPPWLSGADARSLDEYRTEELSFVSAAAEANRLIREWADAQDEEGRRLDDVARYEGIPFWEAVEFELFYGFLASLLDELLLWERILDVEKPARLVVPADPSAAIARAAAAARAIPVHPFREDSRGSALGVSRRRPIPARMRSVLRRGRQSLLRWRATRHHCLSPVRCPPGAVRRILVLTLVRRFVDVVIPVIRALEEDPANHVLVVDRNFSTAVPRLEAEGIPFRVFDGYSDRAIRRRVGQQETRFRLEWRRLSGDPTFRRCFTYRRVDLWTLVAPAFQECFTAVFGELVRVVEITRNLLRAERPHVVVLTDERPPFQRVFTLACRQLGVPTVGVQDTLFPDLPYGSPIATDWIAVEGEVARDNLVKGGTSSEKIVVTGQPRFDFVAQRGGRFDRETILRRLELAPARATILVVSQFAGIYFRQEDKRAAFQGIYAAVAALPDAQLVVKLHPDERDGSVERDLAASAGLAAYRILTSGESLELVFASDLVIVFFSTVGHEALLLDRPLIQVRTGRGEGPIISFTEEGGGLDGRRLEELPDLVRAALYDPAVRERLRKGREAYIRRHVHALDGRSGARVAELVVNATRGGER